MFIKNSSSNRDLHCRKKEEEEKKQEIHLKKINVANEIEESFVTKRDR